MVEILDVNFSIQLRVLANPIVLDALLKPQEMGKA